MADDEIILEDLSDDELVQQMHDDLYDGMKEEIEDATNILLKRGWVPYDILTQALVEGMRIVGVDFRDGILFVPEVLLSANAMKAGMFILRRCSPPPARQNRARWSSAPSRGDIHDIGKNCRHDDGRCGFRRHRSRHQQSVENYLDAIEREKRISSACPPF